MTVDLVSGDTAPFSTSHTSNWVAKAGGLPGRVRAIARGIQKSTGWPLSRCIATAVNMVERTRDTGRVFGGKAKATTTTKVAHTAAANEWDAKRASRHLALPSAGLDLVSVSVVNSSDGGFVASSTVIPMWRRKIMASKGVAMKDGSYPIPTRAHVGKAVQSIGRAPAAKQPAVRAHIRKRAKALGMPVPEGAKKK